MCFGKIKNMKVEMKSWLKFALGFLVLFAVAIALIGAVFFVREWRERRKIDALAEGLERYEREEYARMMADTYGGKTPQETLTLYIAAVEKGDFELASRYLILEKRDPEKARLSNAKTENRTKYIALLKNSLTIQGEIFGDTYIVDDPIYLKFQKYPSNIWKIVEI